MSIQTTSVLPHQTEANKGRGRLPPGCRALYVYVPEQTFNWAKAQAHLSGLRFSDYIVRLLKEGQAFKNDDATPR